MKNEFSRCPHCKSLKSSSWVYECSKCGRIMCYYDDGIFGLNNSGCWKGDRCPDCASHRKKDGIEIIKAIGIIYNR